nr:hypothetical protein [Tanacetum cinerariifolium]
MKYYLSSVILFEEVVNALKPRKIVGLDIRKRYVGVAITDLNIDRAYPLSCLERKDNNDELALQIHRSMKEWGAGSLIIGQPNDGRMKNPDHVATLLDPFYIDHEVTKVAGQDGAGRILLDYLDGANRYGYHADQDYRSDQDWDV